MPSLRRVNRREDDPRIINKSGSSKRSGPRNEAPEAASPHAKGRSTQEDDPFSSDAAEIKRRSVLAYKHGATHKEIDAGKYPTNEQIVQALQLKVAKSVDIATRYRRVLWYSLFVTVYLIVLYLQASAYKSADVVSTLRNALMVDGQLSMTFSNEDEVLAYIGNKILLPTWKDPVCGDGQCEYPWEYPAFGRFGCQSDCGVDTNTTKIAVNIRANFVGHPSISPRVLMSSVRWNLCLNDPARTARGEPDLCWWDKDQTFNDVKVNIIESADIIEGTWYVIIKGDYTGRVSGSVYDLTNPQQPEQVELTPKWEKCKLPEAVAQETTGQETSSTRLRKLLATFKKKRQDGDQDPELLAKLRKEHFPDLPDVNASLATGDIKDKLQMLSQKRKQLEILKRKLEGLKQGRKLSEISVIEDDD
eukprot:jgi/Ulvmu1/6968/UM033_0025.1